MITEKKIEEAFGKHWLPDPRLLEDKDYRKYHMIGVKNAEKHFTAGVKAGEKMTLEMASEGFEEWYKNNCKPVYSDIPPRDLVTTWQASSLNHMAKIEELEKKHREEIEIIEDKLRVANQGLLEARMEAELEGRWADSYKKQRDDALAKLTGKEGV